MNTPEPWKILERLADPSLSAAERAQLESAYLADPESRERWTAFRQLQDWPELERGAASDSPAAVKGRLLERLWQEREREATDREVTRLFPLFAASALALALTVGLVNMTEFRETASDSIDALFGLPASSVDNELLTQL